MSASPGRGMECTTRQPPAVSSSSAAPTNCSPSRLRRQTSSCGWRPSRRATRRRPGPAREASSRARSASPGRFGARSSSGARNNRSGSSPFHGMLHTSPTRQWQQQRAAWDKRLREFRQKCGNLPKRPSVGGHETPHHPPGCGVSPAATRYPPVRRAHAPAHGPPGRSTIGPAPRPFPRPASVAAPRAPRAQSSNLPLNPSAGGLPARPRAHELRRRRADAWSARGIVWSASGWGSAGGRRSPKGSPGCRVSTGSRWWRRTSVRAHCPTPCGLCASAVRPSFRMASRSASAGRSARTPGGWPRSPSASRRWGHRWSRNTSRSYAPGGWRPGTCCRCHARATRSTCCARTSVSPRTPCPCPWPWRTSPRSSTGRTRK